MRRLTDLVLLRPRLVLMAFLAVCAAATWVHMERGRWDFSYESMAPKGTPEVAAFDRFQEDFDDDSSTVFLIAFTADPLVTDENLAMIERITAGLEQLDDTDSVLSLSNFADIRAAKDGLEVSEFVEEIPVGPPGLGHLGDRFASDPIVSGGLISPDGRTTAIIGRMTDWAADPVVRERYFAGVDAVLEEEEGVEFHMAGIPYMDNILMEYIERDTKLMMPLSVIVLALMVWFAFGRMRATWMTIAPFLIAGALTLGTMSAVGIPMTLLTGEPVLMLLILVIGISNGVHILNRYEEDIRLHDDGQRRSALISTMRHMGRACLLTSVTTAVGFAALATSNIPSIRDFGIFGALGIMLAYVGAVVFLPAAVAATERRKPWRVPPTRGSDLLDRFLISVASLPIRNPKTVIATGLVLVAISVVATGWVQVDNRYSRDLKSDNPALVSMDFLHKAFGGSFVLDMVVDAGEPDGIKDPELLAAMDKLGAGMEEHGLISKVFNPVTFIKKMNQAMTGGDPKAFRVPGSAEAVAQYLLLFEMAGGDSEYDRMVSYDYSKARMGAYTIELDPEEYESVLGHLRGLVDRIFGSFGDSIEVYEAGGLPLFYTVSNELISTLMRSLYLAMPVIVVITAFAFRSVRLGLLSVLPNVIPITVGLGLLGLTGISLRFSTIVAFPIAFGLAIDDTIHFLHRYRLELQGGAGHEEAVRTALRTAGRAMVLTTVFLIAGFAVMLASNFLAMVHMSLTLGVILVAALFGDLLVLPALLQLFVSRGPGRS